MGLVPIFHLRKYSSIELRIVTRNLASLYIKLIYKFIYMQVCLTQLKWVLEVGNHQLTFCEPYLNHTFCNHTPLFDDFSVLAHVNKKFRFEIKESLLIKQDKCRLNKTIIFCSIVLFWFLMQHQRYCKKPVHDIL